MKTCLKLYHHSSFDDEISPARKINVELTAGGGGSKSESRKEKLHAKNEKLNEERKRKTQEEEKVERRKQEKKDKTKGKATKVTDGAAVGAPTEAADDQGIHPSRRAQVKL